MRYIGLDVHKDVIQAHISDDRGGVLLRHRFGCSREHILAFAEQHGGEDAEVVLEATFHTWAIVDLLRPHFAKVVVANPMQVKAIATAKIKTDKVDARILAELLRTDFLPEVWQPDAQTLRLRQWSAMRSSLVADRTMIKNRIHAILNGRLIKCPAARVFSKPGLQWLEALTDDELGEVGHASLRAQLRLLKAVEEEIATVEETIAREVWKLELAKLLMTIPGVSQVVALGILAALGDIGRFKTPDKVAGYFGLVPSTRQSANTCYNGPITKRGNSHGRWLLIQAAQHLVRNKGPLGHQFRRLKKRKNHNVAVVAMARKLAIIVWHMLKKREPYRYAEPDATRRKLIELRTGVTGVRRRGGITKGSPPSNNGGPTRRVPSLNDVLTSENLPPATLGAAGELAMIDDCGLTETVRRIHSSRRVPRKVKC